MNWYYMDSGQEAGPFDKNQMQELVHKGVIKDSTQVRNDGSLDWVTYSQLMAMASKKASTHTGQKAPEQYKESAYAGQDTDTCSECGDAYAIGKLVTFGEKRVCPLCAPSLLQQVGEGGAGMVFYAGFWIRFLAKIIDGLILLVPLAAINIAIAITVPDMDISGNFRGELTPAAIAGLVLMYMLQIAIPLTYNTFFVGRYAATPGKMALGLRIILPGGGRISYLRALGRHFAEFLSQITLYIGYIMAGFDNEKRALHDHVAGTRVVMKQSGRAL